MIYGCKQELDALATILSGSFEPKMYRETLKLASLVVLTFQVRFWSAFWGPEILKAIRSKALSWNVQLIDETTVDWFCLRFMG